LLIDQPLQISHSDLRTLKDQVGDDAFNEAIQLRNIEHKEIRMHDTADGIFHETVLVTEHDK
jgi:hypothetical protein